MDTKKGQVYKPSLIAFIEVLNYSEFEVGPEYYKRFAYYFENSPDFPKQSVTGGAFKVFENGIIISCDDIIRNYPLFFGCIAAMSVDFFVDHLLLRGVITLGNGNTPDQELIETCKVEAPRVFFPRIMISDSLLKKVEVLPSEKPKMNTAEEFFKMGIDGKWYIDFITEPIKGRGGNLNEAAKELVSYFSENIEPQIDGEYASYIINWWKYHFNSLLIRLRVDTNYGFRDFGGLDTESP